MTSSIQGTLLGDFTRNFGVDARSLPYLEKLSQLFRDFCRGKEKDLRGGIGEVGLVQASLEQAPEKD